jgi:probable HAF family extracellular repeat protein
MTKANRLTLSVLIVLSLAAFAAAQSYTVTDLGPGDALAINSLGDVAIDNSGNSFVWTPSGSLLALPPLPGDSFTTPKGINRKGLAVGESVNRSNGVYSAVLWTNGEPLDLGTLSGGKDSWAIAINASGEVAGISSISVGQEAFLWTKATGMQGLGSLAGGGDSEAFAINRFGQVAGKSDCGSNCEHAVLWSKAKGSMLDLGLLPGANSSFADGINNAGQVVGASDYVSWHAFVWSPSTGMLDLNNLIPANSGWLLQSANAINDQGQIVGYGTLNGQTEAFLLTPQ